MRRIMKNLIANIISHKDLYLIVTFLTGVMTTLIDFLTTHSEKQVFGISVVIWVLIFLINLVDIHTGIKANTKQQKDLGKRFKFESSKGWRALEKIFVFTTIVAFLYFFEKELFRLDFPKYFQSVFTFARVYVFFYVVLVELQSIGENEEIRFGKKSKLFSFLDNVIEVVNDGILEKIKNLFR